MRAETLLRAVRTVSASATVSSSPYGKEWRDTTAGASSPATNTEKVSFFTRALAVGFVFVRDGRHARGDPWPPRWLRIAGGFTASVSASNTKTWPELRDHARVAASKTRRSPPRARTRHTATPSPPRAPKTATRTRRVATKVSRAFRRVSFPGEPFSPFSSDWSRTASVARRREERGVRFFRVFRTGSPRRLAPRTPRRPPPCPARARPGSRPRARSRVFPGDPRPCPRRATKPFRSRNRKDAHRAESVPGGERVRVPSIEPSAPSSLDINRPRSSRGRNKRSSRRRFRHPRRPRTREAPEGAHAKTSSPVTASPATRRACVRTPRRRAEALRSPTTRTSPRAPEALAGLGDVVRNAYVFFEKVQRPDRAFRGGGHDRGRGIWRIRRYPPRPPVSPPSERPRRRRARFRAPPPARARWRSPRATREPSRPPRLSRRTLLSRYGYVGSVDTSSGALSDAAVPVRFRREKRQRPCGAYACNWNAHAGAHAAFPESFSESSSSRIENRATAPDSVPQKRHVCVFLVFGVRAVWRPRAEPFASVAVSRSTRNAARGSASRLAFVFGRRRTRSPPAPRGRGL